MSDSWWSQAAGVPDPSRVRTGKVSRCSRCSAPSVTQQKGYQRCEVCWELDQDDIEHSVQGPEAT